MTYMSDATLSIPKNIAGNPPRYESILIPSIPSDVMNIRETIPTVAPQIILMYVGASCLPSVIPVVEILAIALVVESVAVINEIKIAIK